MKVKGISIFERHVEKVVLVVFVLVFLGVFAAQFLREPNQVQIDKEWVAPSKIAERIEKQAGEGVISRLDQSILAVDLPPPPEPDAFLSPLQVTSVSQAPLTQIGNLSPGDSAALANTGNGNTPGQGLPTDLPYHVPEVPSVTNTLAVLYGGTVDPFVREAHPELAEYLPAEQPYDAFWVTVQGSFDVTQFRKGLLDLPGEEEAQLPRDWTNAVEILAVDIIRERQDSSGGWVEQETIGELPGHVSLRERLDDPALKPQELLTDLLTLARDAREAIRRPAFYPIISGDRWTWPSQILATGFSAEDIRTRDRLVRQRRVIAGDIARIERQLNPNTKQPASSPSRDERRERGDVGPMGATPKKTPLGTGPDKSMPSAQAGGRPGSRDRSRSTADRERESREQLQESLKSKQAELARIDGELAKLGFDTSGLPMQGEQSSFEETNAPLNSDDESIENITLWAHDLTARQGETYRYALRVRVTNPLFGKAEQVPPQQVEQTQSPVLASAPTDWSTPIAVPTQTMYFVTSGNDGGGLSGIGSRTTATVQVFRFFYGYWRMEELTLSPGESLATQINLPSTLQLFSIATADDGTAPKIESRESVPATLTFDSDTVLLDVALAEAGGGQRWVSVFLANDGDVVVRDPEHDEDSNERLRYSESAQHGEAGVVKEPSYRPATAAAGGDGGRSTPPSGREERREERPRDPSDFPTGQE